MAPFSPMPFTPGTLSEESPMIASTSVMCSGPVPNFSRTASAPWITTLWSRWKTL